MTARAGVVLKDCSVSKGANHVKFTLVTQISAWARPLLDLGGKPAIDHDLLAGDESGADV
eukprot:SAG22_NODE_13893_length_391_cov_1.815068_2_plen_59_part_01